MLRNFNNNNNNSNGPGYFFQRRRMVEKQLEARDISDDKVLKTMLEVERHHFVSPAMIHRAYDDCALPIGHEQTISQPYIVALMTQALGLTGNENVLEIGTGSGYQTAILAGLCERVFSIERVAPLGQNARKLLDSMGYTNIIIQIGDGTLGLPEYAPFDRIIVTAGAPDMPESLLNQLKEDGFMAIPVGDRNTQKLQKVWKTEDETKVETICGCTFVPLIGQQGWK